MESGPRGSPEGSASRRLWNDGVHRRTSFGGQKLTQLLGSNWPRRSPPNLKVRRGRAASARTVRNGCRETPPSLAGVPQDFGPALLLSGFGRNWPALPQLNACGRARQRVIPSPREPVFRSDRRRGTARRSWEQSRLLPPETQFRTACGPATTRLQTDRPAPGNSGRRYALRCPPPSRRPHANRPVGMFHQQFERRAQDVVAFGHGLFFSKRFTRVTACKVAHLPSWALSRGFILADFPARTLARYQVLPTAT
jgi:hypothetical protein